MIRSISAAHNLGYRTVKRSVKNADGEVVGTETRLVAIFELDGKQVRAWTDSETVPQGMNGINIDSDSLQDAAPFKGSDGTDVTPTWQTAKFVTWKPKTVLDEDAKLTLMSQLGFRAKDEE